jgi:hypothetical protein
MATAIEKKIEKIDINKVVKMRFINGMTYADIGKVYHVSAQAIEQRLNGLKRLFEKTGAIDYVEQNYVDTVKRVNHRLLLELLDTDKLKSASLNNTAYSLQVANKILAIETDRPTDNVNIQLNQINDIKSKALDMIAKLRKQDNPQGIPETE